eukprot:COSAG05_NODE_1221_length_5476_cov_72.306305_12_plen_80_part_00
MALVTEATTAQQQLATLKAAQAAMSAEQGQVRSSLHYACRCISPACVYIRGWFHLFCFVGVDRRSRRCRQIDIQGQSTW